MARQLQTKGEAVGLVALFDSGVNAKSGTALLWSFLRNLSRDFPSWLTGAWQLTGAQWLALIRLKIGRAKAGLTIKFRPTPERFETYSAKLINEMGDVFQFSEQHRKVARAQYQALRNYRPRIYPGRLTLFRARMQPFFSLHDPEKGWGKLAAGGLDINVVPGNHLGMLQEPHVQVLAQKLSSCLDRAFAESRDATIG
jgi:thioesterase domain-containing protein